MTKQTSNLSRLDFDGLIARAIQLDEEGGERIDLERARAIASELGISASAWDEALRERESVAQAVAGQRSALKLRRRAWVISLVGIATGGLSGALAGQLGDGVLLLGGVAVAAAAALIVDGVRRRSVRTTQIELAAWWLSIPTGIMLGMKELHVDPVIFATVAWVGCSSASLVLDRLMRRDPAPPRLAESPTG